MSLPRKTAPSARSTGGGRPGRVAVLVLCLWLTVGACGTDLRPPPPSASSVPNAPTQVAVPPVFPATGNPFDGRPIHVRGDTAAALAAASASGVEAELLSRIAAVPTATWLLPEIDPVGAVGTRVADVVAEAGALGEVAVFVVYGISNRDCVSGFSRGGLPEGEYLEWVREIGDAAGGAVIVLEPDALASVDQCSLPGQRLDLLRETIGVLEGGPTTYLDAGHSDWLDARTTVSHLERVGVHRIRGFALNVAGHGREHDEVAYGRAVIDALGSGHFVVDTGRSGAGSNGEWCNPPGRALGPLPGGVRKAGPFDARLWIKPPGESDGTCGGGPPAGEFWPERAVELARAAGW